MPTPTITPNPHPHGSFDAACHTARERSALHRCTIHVNARVALSPANIPVITGCHADDWYSDATLVTYVDGKLQD